MIKTLSTRKFKIVRISIFKALLLFCFFANAQNNNLISSKVIWTWGEDDGNIELSTGNIAVIEASSLLRVLTNGTNQIIRLSNNDDTIVLITIPRLIDLEPNQIISQIRSIKMVIDNSKIGASYISEYNINRSLFEEAYLSSILNQEPAKDYVKEIGLEFIPGDPEKIQISLRGGGYGNATLIYSSESATPQIIIHD